jgi:hypothetical protein
MLVLDSRLNTHCTSGCGTLQIRKVCLPFHLSQEWSMCERKYEACWHAPIICQYAYWTKKKEQIILQHKTWHSKQILCVLYTANQNTLIIYFNLGF